MSNLSWEQNLILKITTITNDNLNFTYSLSQNGWDTLGSPCPLNVGVQDLVTELR